MNSEIICFAKELFPFKNMKEKNLQSILSEIDVSVCSFQKGETVFSKESYRKSVGFIMDGECEVERERADGDCISLNTLGKYASFGILSVFSSEAEFPTVIKAVKASRVMFIGGDDMIAIIKKYPTVSMNVITFLSGRIAFLNKKVETFSGKSTVDKLATYLLTKYKELGNEITVTRTKLSAEIGVGRASLYRDLDCLESKGIIKTEQKKIILICPEGLERILK